MNKNILVPTNFSKQSWNALVYGLLLFREIPATFYILNSYKSRELFQNEKFWKEKSTIGLDKILKGLKFRKENSSHRFETISSGDYFGDAIEEVLQGQPIDLIIVGTGGEALSNKPEFHLPLNSIIDHSDRPILLIPEGVTLSSRKVNEIVFPTDFRFPFQKEELFILKFFARRFHVPIRILHVQENEGLSSDQEKHRNELKEIFAHLDHSFHRLRHDSILEGIFLFVQSRESGIVALYDRKHNFFKRIFSEVILESLEFDGTVPILLLKEKIITN